MEAEISYAEYVDEQPFENPDIINSHFEERIIELAGRDLYNSFPDTVRGNRLTLSPITNLVRYL